MTQNVTKTGEITQPWRTLEVTYPFVTPWFKLRHDRVCTHLEEEIGYTYHEHPGCAMVVALTCDKNVVLLEHYRYPVRAWCWEVPAGRLQERRSSLETAQRELLQETGGVGACWRFVARFYTSTGSSSEQSEVFLADDVSFQSSQPESTELLRVALVPWERAFQMALTGQISDGPSALALLLSRAHVETLLGAES